MNVLMQLVETQRSGTSSPRFSSLGKSANGGGPFAELLAALQNLNGELALDPILANQLAALESQPTLFAALMAQPIPFDGVVGDGETAEGAVEEGTSALPGTFDQSALLEELSITANPNQGTPVPNGTSASSTAVPEAEDVVPQQRTATRPDLVVGRPIEGMATDKVQSAQRSAEVIAEVAPPPIRPQSTARFTQVENRARAAEEASAALKTAVEIAIPGASEPLEGGELERLTLRLGHASERALAGGWHAIARLNPELADKSVLQTGQQINTTTGLSHQTPATTATTPSMGTGEAPTTAAPPQQVRVEHIGTDLVRTVRFLANSEQSTITVKLIPAHLGELQVEVMRRGEEITVRLLSGQSSVRETIESQVHLLREQLTRDGTVIHRIEVAPQLGQDSQQGQSGSREAQQQQHTGAWQGQRRRQEAEEQLPSGRAPDRERHVPNAQSALNIMI